MRIPKKYKYCKICILPDTRPNLKINSNGIVYGDKKKTTVKSLDA